MKDLLEAAALDVTLFASVQDFMDCYEPAWDGCMVLDIRMPGRGGLKLQQHRQAVKCALPIVFVSAEDGVPLGMEVMQGHGFDIFDEPLKEAALVERIRQALHWYEQYIAAEKQRLLIRQIYDVMTPREQEVMQRMARGLSTKQIAAELGVSPRTVEIYRSHVLAKLGASSVADVVHLSLMISDKN